MQANLEIKNYLRENGITQIFLAEKAGIPPGKLSLSLNGERKLTLDEYERICWALDKDTNFFLKPRAPETVE